jgi:hypothetical protein
MRKHPLTKCCVLHNSTNCRATSTKQDTFASCRFKRFSHLLNTREKLKTRAFKVIKDHFRHTLCFPLLERETQSIAKITPTCQAFSFIYTIFCA